MGVTFFRSKPLVPPILLTTLLTQCQVEPADSLLLVLGSNQTPRESSELPEQVECAKLHFTEFGFSSQANQLHKSYFLSGISEDSEVLNPPLPYGALSRAVASFQVAGEEGQVFVDGVLQHSGSSMQDFRNPVLYEIRSSDCSRTIRVEVYSLTPVLDTGFSNCYDGLGYLLPCTNLSAWNQDGVWEDVPNPRILSSPEYPVSGQGVVRDRVTGLIWALCPYSLSPSSNCSSAPGTLDYVNAKNFCEGILNNWNSGAGYAGLKDWRLPTVQELVSIIDRSKKNLIDGLVDPGSFRNSPSDTDSPTTEGFWTDEDDPTNSAAAYRVHFGLFPSSLILHVQNFAKTTPRRVRCVSGVRPPPRDYEIVEFGKIVRDHRSSLEWLRCAAGQSVPNCLNPPLDYSWDLSLQHCSSQGWRLPNVNEILSLHDYRISGSGLDPNFFPNAPSGPSGEYWTSTTDINLPNYSIFLDSNGSLDTKPKGNAMKVRCVRSQ